MGTSDQVQSGVNEGATKGTNNGKRPKWLLPAIFVVLGILGFAFAFFKAESTPNPVFPSLVSAPDTSLHGTVAYYDNPSRCVRVISASGAKSKEVMCMPELDVNKAQKDGKPVGWNLTWRADNRLEITEFLMVDGGPDPVFKPSWQKVVDVVSGAVEETPVAQIAATPTPGSRATISPAGDKVVFTSDSGHGVVDVVDASGKATTVLDAKGNPETYGFKAAHWSPDFKWVAVDDGHLLITTIGSGGQTHTLTPPLQTDYGYDALHWYDITSADLLG